MFVTLILIVFFLVIFLILSFITVNFVFKKMVEAFLVKNEKFENFKRFLFPKNKKINEEDNCKKIDKLGNELLQNQTGTNIPLSPNKYENYVGIIYDDIKENKNDELKKGKYCIYKNELLYDGIWKSKITNPKNGFLKQNWKLTNGNVMNDYICSDNLIQINKKIPKDFIDYSSTPIEDPIDYKMYFNDCIDDPMDIQLSCFPTEFNKGITSQTQNFLSK